MSVREKMFAVTGAFAILAVGAIFLTCGNRPVDLQAALRFATEDPLLALPGVDVEAMSASLDALDGSVHALAEALQKQDRLLGRLTSGAYPLPYLRAMTDLEKKRRAFIATTGAGEWRAYEEAQVTVIAALARAISAYRLLIMRYVPDTRGDYRFAAGVANKQDFLDAVARLQEGIKETRTVFIAQSRCVRGTMAACDETHRGQDIPGYPSSVVGSSDIPADLLAHADLLEKSLPPAIVHDGSYTLVKVERAPRCLSFLQKPLYVAVFDRKGLGDTRALYPHLLNDLYFWDANKVAMKNPRDRYFASMLKFQIPFSYQPIANFYMCPDAIDILSSVATTIASRGGQFTPEELLLARRFRTGGVERIIAWVALQNYSYARGIDRGYFDIPPPAFVLLARAPFPLMFLSFDSSVAGPQQEVARESTIPDFLVPLKSIEGLYSPQEMQALMRKTLLFELGYDVQ